MPTTRRTTLSLAILLMAIPLTALPGAATYHTGGGGGDAGCDHAGPGERAFMDARGSQRVCTAITDLQAFDPAALLITAGTTVNWTNTGALAHTVTLVAGSDGAVALDVVLAPGESVEYTFQSAGAFYIQCTVNLFHQATMHQEVTVI